MKPIHVLAVIFLIFLTTQPQVVNAQNSNLPVAFNVKIAGDDATTRFFLDFDKKLEIKTSYIDNPYRIIIDLDETSFSFADQSAPALKGLIKDVQFGRISSGKSRVVLTLSRPVEIIKQSMQKRLDEDYYRFLLDMDSTDEETFVALLKKQEADATKSAASAIKGNRVSTPKKTDGTYTVVLDPGHGGIDGGAIGRGGAKEKDIVFSFASHLAERIENSGPYKVVMTRDGDQFVSLRERLDLSRNAHADLFISIHADSLSQRFVRGATIYTLSKKASDRLSAQLAESENRVDLLAGLSLENDVEAVSDILADLTMRETKTFSRTFSNILVAKLQDEIFLIKNPQRSAAFGVLKAPDVPSVLLELGYLSNREDEALMQKSEWQKKVAEAITASIAGFFALRK